MVSFRRSVITALLTLAALSCAFGQTATQPQYVLAFGGGFSEASAPHYAATGSFGIRVGDGLYSLSSLDMATKKTDGPLDAKTGKPTYNRVSVSTIRTGMEKVLTQQGPVALLAHGDIGAAVGGGNVVAALSGGGTLTYDIPKHPNLFLYGTIRILKSPQSDPAASSATVQTAAAFGIGLKLGK